jgi:hypothetical protein
MDEMIRKPDEGFFFVIAEVVNQNIFGERKVNYQRVLYTDLILIVELVVEKYTFE